MSMKDKTLLARRIAMGLIIAANSCMAGVAMAEPAANELPSGPTGESIQSGNISINSDRDAGHMTINQNSDKGIINWESFNIGKDAIVEFHHQDASGMTLNRVTGGNMSEIYGHINANGSVILVNPNGAYFAEGSQVNTAGFIVSTADMSDDNFNNGNYVWDQDSEKNSNITVEGNIIVNAGNVANSFSYGNNKIMLIADGDVTIGETAHLIANTSSTINTDKTFGDGFTVKGNDITSEGTIILRADQNADDVALRDTKVAEKVGDDYGTEAFDKTSKNVAAESGQSFKTAKVYLKNTNANQIQGMNVSVYYNSDVVNGIKGTDVSTIGVTSSDTSSPTTFTQKDYRNIESEVNAYKDKIDLNFARNVTVASLVNDVYQLQAIQDVKEIAAAPDETLPNEKTYYGNLGGSYAQGTHIDAKDTENWVDASSTQVGFNPIGNGYDDSNGTDTSQTELPFTGSYTGNGGSNTYNIYDMNINRSNEDCVGLFARVEGATISSTSLLNSQITGKKDVGGIAGFAKNSFFDEDKVAYSDDYNYYKGAAHGNSSVTGEENVGGIVGYSNSTALRNATTDSFVYGTYDVGGLIGRAVGNGRVPIQDNYGTTGYYHSEYVSYDGKNDGTVHGTNMVGGLVGSLSYGTITGDKGSYNSGTISGTNNVGGLVGYMSDSEISNSYNTNEDSTPYWYQGEYLDSNGVLGSGQSSSRHGSVSGDSYVGGIVGAMSNSRLDTVYNAENIEGNNNVGGLAGSIINGGTIKNAYNADNNTVYLSAQNTWDNEEYYGFISNATGENIKYTYDKDSQTWNSYTQNTAGTWTVQNAGLSTEDLPSENSRLYLNRLAYRDATVTGSKNVGGLVGYIGDYNGSGAETILQNTYNAGRVKKSSDSATYVGSLVGLLDDATLYMNDGNSSDGNFVVTTQSVTGKNIVKGDYTDMNVVGGSVDSDGNTTDTANQYNSSDYEKTFFNASSSSNNNASGVYWTDGKNQNDTWIIYNNSTTPLLKQFMTGITNNRQYVYDGTVHNLTTDGVDNYYGGAFFTGGKGQNVYTAGVDTITDSEYNAANWNLGTNKDGVTANQSDDKTYSSFYKYDTTNMWSPQNGYYTEEDAGVIITPKNITATFTAEKTYGQKAKGYVYKDADNEYWVYEGSSGKWTKVGTEMPKGDNGETYYVLTLDDTTLIDQDGKSVLSGWDTVTSSGHSYVGCDGTLELSIDAEGGRKKAANKQYDLHPYGYIYQYDYIYDSTGAIIVTYNTNNYNIKYEGSLRVNKADLLVNASGSREYGDGNGTSGYTFTSLGTSLDENSDNVNDGKLKSFDTQDVTSLITSDNLEEGDYTLRATENTKRGDSGTAYYRYIDEYTWVATGEDGNQTNYTLGKGSFKPNGYYDASSQLTSDNYNIIFVGNASDEQVKAATDNNYASADAYLTSAVGKANNSYTINPANLTYKFTGSHTYGDMDTQDILFYGISGWKNGDYASVYVGDVQKNNLIGNALYAANIGETTHVQRDGEGDVLDVYNGTYSAPNGLITLKNGSINYNLNAAFSYRVNPGTVTVKVSDAEKTYGQTGFANGGTVAFEGFKNGETAETAYTGTGHQNDIPSADTAVIYRSGDVDLAAQQAGAGTYENAAQYSNKNLYFNDYEVNYEDGNVTINKANLLVNASGSREYGDNNGTSDYTFTALGKSQDINSDELNNGMLKSFETKSVNELITSSNLEGNSYTLYATEAAKKGSAGTESSKKIDKSTWVAMDTEGNQVAYTLGEGSFGTNTSQLSSANYNIIFVGNASDEQVKAATGNNYASADAYLTSDDGKAKNSYTINPVSLEYKILGSHRYGDIDTQRIDYGYVGGLKDIDNLSDYVGEEQKEKLKEYALDAANINEATHVKRDSAGNVLGVYNDTYNTPDGQITLKNGSINYNFKGYRFYVVEPGTVTVNMSDVEKTYGDDHFATAPEAQISGFVNGETQTTAYDATTDDSTLKGNVTVQETNLVTYETADGTDLTKTNAAAGTYTGAADYSNKNIYFNDYDVVYNKGTVRINPKKIDYIINDNTKTYGETTSDTAFTGGFDAAQLVGSDTVGNLDSSAFGSTGLNKTAGVGSYDIQLNSGNDEDVRNAINNSNYILGNVINGKLTVNQREVDWSTNDASREYLTNNPDFSGSFSSENTADKSGILAEDAGTIGTISQGSYTIGTGFTSEAGAYTVAVSDGELQNALGGNYKLRNNNKGTMTITPAVFYYQADSVTYPQGDKNLVFTGKVVNGAGIDVTHYLTSSDRSGLYFATTADSGMNAGQYPVYGYGVRGSHNYKMAGLPQLPGNELALTITPVAPDDKDHHIPPVDPDNKDHNITPMPDNGYFPNASVLEDTKGKVERFYGRRDDRVKYGFGYGLEGLHVFRRYLTIQDSGIHLDVAHVKNSIIVDRSSRSDGGDTITIKRKAVVVNSITMAE